MSTAETERQLRWLMTLRVVIVTTLLVCAFAIELLFRPVESLRPLFMLAAAAYGMVLLYAVLDRWLRGTRGFAFVQLTGDALIVTCFIGITGGLNSPMSFLYLLPIAIGSLLLYRRGGMALAAICWLLYTAMVTLGPQWAVVGNAGPVSLEPARLIYYLVAHLIAMVALAMLSSTLSERLRVQGRELVERTGTVVRLQALNENIVGSINSGLVTTDLEGEINFLNRGGTQIINMTSQEVDGESVEALLNMGEGFLNEIRRRLLAQRRFRFERYFDRPDGTKIFLGIAASNLHDKAGRPLGYLFIFQDLTEIHALEQDVRLKERMVALGEMAAGMAHELRNPLAAISGSVQYMKSEYQPEGESLELMDIILRESERLDQAIRDFLTFARPGRFAAERADLVKLIEDSVKLLRKSPEFHRGHRIVTRYPGESVVFDIDPNRMKQVFWNLATNALKSMPDGGRLTIEVRLPDDVEEIEIVFADEGVGMDEAQRARYFQPFNSSFREGTGLGAAIVYRLVEEHQGRIFVDSTPGEGTCIRVRLSHRQGATQGAAPRLVAAGG
ncbi:MAG: PAS domain S-box protein [bacterium]|nr:PAS domain S-box protein [bacterium]